MAGSSVPKPGTDAGRPAPARGSRPVLWSSFSGRALELLAALALTLTFFGGFLALLGLAFPAGESLRALAMPPARDADAATANAPDEGPVVEVGAMTIASLDVLRPDVRRRDAATITWDPAHDGEGLHDRDAVQTGADGRALVRFSSSNELHLERNSLVVVTAPRVVRPPIASGAPAAPAGDELGARRGLVVMEGELFARLQAPDQTRLELSLPNVTARLADTTSTAPARFRVAVRKDHSATVAVLDGRLHLESRSGVVTIGPREFSRVSADGDVSAPRRLPDAPAEVAPGPGAAFAHADLPPRVPFTWSAVPGADHYRVRAARDAAFRDVVLDETVRGDTLTWGRARPGRYWWQVSAILDEIEGVPTGTRELVVRQDAAPLRLVVQPPPRVVHGPSLVLAGEVDARATVYVMGQPVARDRSGRFRAELELQPGANVVVVEAVDPSGHTAYWSQIVHLKP